MDRRQRRAKRREELKESSRQNKTAKTKPARPHALTITFSVIGLLLASIALFWNIVPPDIRYIASLGPETMTVLESKVDGAGNFVHSMRLRPKFTNYSFKPGFIDKAEFVPQSIATLPEIRITSINKTYIFWHQEKQIEITFLMTIPTDGVNHLNTTRELAVEQVLAVFDNTGRKVDHLTDGLFGRIRFNFKEIAKIQLQGIR